MGWRHGERTGSPPAGLEDGIHLLSEPVHVNSFLVEGGEAAALIDTGLGIGNIRRRRETTWPPAMYSALNTHYHFDHTGGNHRARPAPHPPGRRRGDRAGPLTRTCTAGTATSSIGSARRYRASLNPRSRVLSFPDCTTTTPALSASGFRPGQLGVPAHHGHPHAARRRPGRARRPRPGGHPHARAYPRRHLFCWTSAAAPCLAGTPSTPGPSTRSCRTLTCGVRPLDPPAR